MYLNEATATFGKVVNCATETGKTGWVMIEHPHLLMPGDAIPSKPFWESGFGFRLCVAALDVGRKRFFTSLKVLLPREQRKPLNGKRDGGHLDLLQL